MESVRIAQTLAKVVYVDFTFASDKGMCQFLHTYRDIYKIFIF